MTITAQTNKAAQPGNTSVFKPHPENKLMNPKTTGQQTFSARINYYPQGRSERARLESFISGVYKKYYNTEIDEFYPNLLSIESVNEEQQATIKAVAGVRSADQEALFSEYYLGGDLQDILGAIYHKPVSRSAIVEVGNLAPANIGQMRWLITSITGFLYSAGYDYLVFTGVAAISNSFKRMNIPLELLAEAKRESLPAEIQEKWGPEYYQNRPMVFLGDIALGYEIMKKNIYTSNRKLIPLFEKACQVGAQLKKERQLADAGVVNLHSEIRQLTETLKQAELNTDLNGHVA